MILLDTSFLIPAAPEGRGTMEDCMIAATALRLDVRLATANRRDFLRFQQHGLRLAEDGE